MLERAINGYWVLYAMMGICVVGMLSRLWLAGIYSGLLKDVQYAKEPKKKLIKQMKEKYEACYRLSKGMSNVEAFLVRNLYGYRFMGMTLGGIQKISGQAFFLCVLIGGLTASYTYAYGMPLEITGIYSVAAIAMAALLIYINCIFDIKGRQVVLEAGIVDYLQNYFSAVLDKQEGVQKVMVSSEKETETAALHSELREASAAERKQPSIESATIRKEQKEGRQAEKIASVFRRKEKNKQPENTFAKEQAEQLLLELRKNPRRGREESQEMASELENFRSSLNQIAADLEKGRSGENRQLAEEEMRIVEEILGEFLA